MTTPLTPDEAEAQSLDALIADVNACLRREIRRAIVPVELADAVAQAFEGAGWTVRANDAAGPDPELIFTRRIEASPVAIKRREVAHV